MDGPENFGNVENNSYSLEIVKTRLTLCEESKSSYSLGMIKRALTFRNDENNLSLKQRILSNIEKERKR